MTRKFLMAAWLVVATMAFAVPAQADKWTDTIDLFKNAGESREFFGKSYGYAVFPTVGKAGLGIGGAYGEGRVYRGGVAVGRTKFSQLSVGWQAGGQGYSLIIFFEDKRAYDDFTSGSFEFGAQAFQGRIVVGVAVGKPFREDLVPDGALRPTRDEISVCVHRGILVQGRRLFGDQPEPMIL